MPNCPIRTIISDLQLEPHPEGGYYRETFRSSLKTEAGRASGTAIYYLLPEGEFSAFHRVRSADEQWHLYRGGDLELHLIDRSGNYSLNLLSSNFERGRPTCTVEADIYQAARPVTGAGYCLCGCTVAPGFEFEDFEMPNRAELIATYSQHEGIVRELTRA